MIVSNGYIKVISETGGGFDNNGDPVEVVETLGNPIPCNYVRNNYQGKGQYDGGVFTSASYTILIDNQDFSPCRFKLYTSNNQMLGEYEVHNKGIVNLFAVGNIQLSV